MVRGPERRMMHRAARRRRTVVVDRRTAHRRTFEPHESVRVGKGTSYLALLAGAAPASFARSSARAALRMFLKP